MWGTFFVKQSDSAISGIPCWTSVIEEDYHKITTMIRFSFRRQGGLESAPCRTGEAPPSIPVSFKCGEEGWGEDEMVCCERRDARSQAMIFGTLSVPRVAKKVDHGLNGQITDVQLADQLAARSETDGFPIGLDF